MKKTLMLLAVLLVLALLPAARAEDTETYFIPEANMCLELPAGFYALTRGMSPDDPVLDEFLGTPEEIAANLENSNTYIEAPDPTFSFRITVKIIKDRAVDFDKLSDRNIEEIILPRFEEASKRVMILSGTELYRGKHTRFIRYYGYNVTDGIEYRWIQYCTVKLSKSIYISLSTEDGSSPTAEHAELLQKVADSVRFVAEPYSPRQPKKNQSGTYRDDRSGANFTLPQGWTEVNPPALLRGYKEAAFVSSDGDAGIYYARRDLWNTLPGWQKLGFSREALGNDYFANAVRLQNMFGVEPRNIRRVFFGSKMYFRFETERTPWTREDYRLQTMTVLMRCENGWLHFFMFTGTEDEAGFAEFEELVRSAEYPPAPSKWEAGITAAGGVLLICVILAVMYRYVPRRGPLPRRKAIYASAVFGFAAALLMLTLILLIFGGTLLPVCGGLLGGVGMYFVLVSGSEPEPEHL